MANPKQKVRKDSCITLKWGTLKGWHGINEKTLAILQEWSDLGVSMSAMAQENSPEQIELILKALDAHDGQFYLDWDGKYVTKKEAKKYITEYGKE